MAVTHGPTSSTPAASHGSAITPAPGPRTCSRRSPVGSWPRCGSPSGSRSCGRSSTRPSPSASAPGSARPVAATDRFGPAAWIHGGNPTQGFLAFGAKGPFEGFYHSIAGATWVNWLFMLGLLGIGLALTFGVAMRFGAAAGAVMYLMMWTVALPPGHEPGDRRPHPRRAHRRRPGPARCRQHLGSRPLVVPHRRGGAPPRPPLVHARPRPTVRQDGRSRPPPRRQP